MKKVSLVILFLLAYCISFSQFTITQNLGAPKTLVVSKGGLSADSALILPYYPDTTTANLSPYVKYYAGNMIRVGNVVYVRNSTATGWITIGSGGGGGTGTVTSISQGYGITNTPNPITTTGTIKVDTATLSVKYMLKTDTTNKFVNNITRTPGKDSIIFFIGANRYAIKDSAGGGGVTSVTASAPLTSSGGTTPNISISLASSISDGYLNSTNFNIFNSKISNVTATGLLTSSGGGSPDISSSMSANKLVGRNPSTSGAFQEITLGSGLTLTGTTLSATGGGGGGSQNLQQVLDTGYTLNGNFYFQTNTSDSIVNLSGSLLTESRTYNFPDANGTIALTSDLTPPTYQIDLTSANYGMGTYGTYQIKVGTDSTTPYYISFPSASSNTGKRITLVNNDNTSFNNAIIDTTGEASTIPKYQGTNRTIWDIPYGMSYEFLSIDGKWMCTSPTPVYVDTFASDYDGTGITTYNIPFNGTYKLVNVNGSKQNDYYIVTFPDPKKNNGERITLINADTIYSLKIEGTWIPLSKNSFGGLVVKVAPQSTYEFVSIDSQWVCVNKSTHPTVFNIDLSVGDYKIPSNGIFQINDASTNDIIFPEAVEFDGTTIIVINSDNTNDATIGGTQPQDASGTAVANIGLLNSYTFVSIGGKWFLINVY